MFTVSWDESAQGGGDAQPSTALFDFGHVQLEKAVQPCQQFLPATSDQPSVMAVAW